MITVLIIRRPTKTLTATRYKWGYCPYFGNCVAILCTLCYIANNFMVMLCVDGLEKYKAKNYFKTSSKI